MSTVCLWELDTGCCQAVWDAADTATQTRAQDYATVVLHGLTGRRFGPCPMTVRPCLPCKECSSYQTYGVLYDSGNSTGMWIPYVWDGTWRNCGCFGACSCTPESEVWLPGPVSAVSEVRVDNVTVDTDAYRVDDHEWLVRTDGGAWPETQTLGNPASSTDDTFVVTYLRGEPVPDGGRAAAGSLACEFVKACTGQKCRLPVRVTSVSRQGVSISAQETIAAGSTGLAEVDLWVAAVNPAKLRMRPTAYSTDLPIPRVTTWGV